MSSTGPIPRIARACLLVLLLSLSASHSHAQAITFNIDTENESKVVSFAPVDLDGTPYISLPLLMVELGGAYNLLPTRVRVDYGGTTAWLTVDDVRVHALSIFSLTHPIRKVDNDTLIAATDVTPFFLKAFRARMTVSEPLQAPPDAPETPTAPESEGPSDSQAISIRPLAEPLNVIVIDPGHGGYDQGLVGIAGYQEKVLCLDVALRLKTLLEETLTQTIVLTRTEDIGISIEDRARLASESEGDLLISIHAGATRTPGTSGIAIYYRPSSGLTARRGLLSRTMNIVDNDAHPSRAFAYSVAGALTTTTSAALRGVHSAPARLLQQAARPSIMIEVGCLTNLNEEALMQSPEYREQIAQGIADGLLAYLKTRDASSRSSEARAAGTGRPDTRR
ncbi:MAG: N-acetylmuramoyl-L-alanine amidase [Candidatus Hydrogenedentes bacterium]|nr:N-acetylmuramoyl-L-alanine amidase [Candidatus Hydrogenedentota bacterium]